MTAPSQERTRATFPPSSLRPLEDCNSRSRVPAVRDRGGVPGCHTGHPGDDAAWQAQSVKIPGGHGHS